MSTANRKQIKKIPFAVLIILVHTMAAFTLTGQALGAVRQEPVVRLLLSEDQPRAVVRGGSLVVERSDSGTWYQVPGRIRQAAFGKVPGGVRLEGSGVGASGFRVRPAGGQVRYEGRTYRGYLTVLPGSRGLIVISHIPLEAYLVGVVNGEIDSNWPMEAVKAQIVAARSYALYQIRSRAPVYDLKTDVTDLVYAGSGSEDLRAASGVSATRGQVLYSGGKLIRAFFHSSCGGRTASAREVWGLAEPAHSGVVCGMCGESPFAHWQVAPSAQELVKAVRALHPGAADLKSLGIHRRSRDGRVQTLFAETGTGRILIDGGEFRKQLGYRKLPSIRFTIGMSRDRIVFTGSGYGHGVGLCQWGARGSAESGMDYRQILRKYYRGTEVRKVY